MPSFRNLIRVLRAARKPDGESFKLSLKVTGLGTVLLGVLGFTIQLVASVIQMLPPPTIPREYVLYTLVALLAVGLAVITYGRRARWW